MGEFENFRRLQSGFRRLARGLAEQFLRGVQLGFAAAVVTVVGNERAQSLPPVDDAFAFQFLVSALDRDDADQQIFRERAKRGQRRAGLEAAFADFTLQLVGDLLIKRAIRRRRNRPDQQGVTVVRHLYLLFIHDINSKSRQYFCGLEAWEFQRRRKAGRGLEQKGAP